MDAELASYTRYLHDNIPLTAAMDVAVSFYDGRRVKLRAPFAPNINHRHTVFGGSIATIGILAGWFVLHERLAREKAGARLVIQKSTVDYLRPGVGEFSADCELDEEQVAPFLATLARHGKARLTLTANIEAAGTLIATHQGLYVALAGTFVKP